jgi:hypothetical protein
MSWIVLVLIGALPAGRSRRGRAARPARLEDLLDVVAALLHPDQPQPEAGDAVADQVVGRLAGDVDDEEAALGADGHALVEQVLPEHVPSLVDLDGQHAARGGVRLDGLGAQQLPAVDDDDVVADPLQFA